jgi:hypothetical protein
MGGGSGMRVKKILLGTGLALFLLLAFTWIGKEVVVEPRNYKSDFYWIWYGSQAVLHQKSPYNAQATSDIQTFFGGRPIETGQYTHPFPFPAYLALAFLPFGLLPYPAALIIWIGLQFPLLFTALYLMKDFLNLDIQGLKLIPYLFAGSIGFFYPVLSYSLGQLGIFMLFLFVLTFYLLKIGSVGWAGVILALIAIRPDMFLIAFVASLVILWNSIPKLKQLVLSTVASLVVMNLATIFLLGFWYLDWIKTISYYSSNNPFVHWPPDTLLTHSGTKVALILMLFVYLIWQAFQFWNNSTQQNKLLVISALIIVFLTLTKLTGSYHMTLLLIPALILLRFYAQLNLQWIMWVMLFSPWIFWAIYSKIHPWSDQLLVPLSMLVLQVIFIFASRNRSSTGNSALPHVSTE